MIEWDGDDTAKSAVKVTDLSSNGTFVSGFASVPECAH